MVSYVATYVVHLIALMILEISNNESNRSSLDWYNYSKDGFICHVQTDLFDTWL